MLAGFVKSDHEPKVAALSMIEQTFASQGFYIVIGVTAVHSASLRILYVRIMPDAGRGEDSGSLGCLLMSYWMGHDGIMKRSSPAFRTRDIATSLPLAMVSSSLIP